MVNVQQDMKIQVTFSLSLWLLSLRYPTRWWFAMHFSPCHFLYSDWFPCSALLWKLMIKVSFLASFSFSSQTNSEWSQLLWAQHTRFLSCLYCCRSKNGSSIYSMISKSKKLWILSKSIHVSISYILNSHTLLIRFLWHTHFCILRFSKWDWMSEGGGQLELDEMWWTQVPSL